MARARRAAESSKRLCRCTAKNLDLHSLAGDDAKAPWHFKLLMVMLAVYLGWRMVYLFI